MTLSEQQVEKLIERSLAVMKNAYCPYSDFPVGAALVTHDGTIFAGCNVENAAYPLGICAEKTAISKAVSEGHRSFKAIAITGLLQDMVPPCGSCRQFLAEFGTDWDVYMVRHDRSYMKLTVGELLPHGFAPSMLHNDKAVPN